MAWKLRFSSKALVFSPNKTVLYVREKTSPNMTGANQQNSPSDFNTDTKNQLEQEGLVTNCHYELKMNEAQLRRGDEHERRKERQRVRSYECTGSTLFSCLECYYCGRSAEAAVLPLVKLVKGVQFFCTDLLEPLMIPIRLHPI